MSETNKKAMSLASAEALKLFNRTYGTAYDFGSNYDKTGSEFETFYYNFLFPKINETRNATTATGNRFWGEAKNVTKIGQLNEEYVILDSIPIGLDLSQPETLRLERNIPQMKTKLYKLGEIKKQKFTFNNNDMRTNFATIGDGTAFFLNVLNKKFYDINVLEEREYKAMLVDYALNKLGSENTALPAANKAELLKKIGVTLFDLQDNNHIYHEAMQASGLPYGRYTTVSKLLNLRILTDNETKYELLDSKLAIQFKNEGLDFSSIIYSFKDLGKIYRLTADVTVEQDETLLRMKAIGDYQTKKGNVIPEGSLFTYDINDKTKFPEFEGKFIEIKPETENFAYVYDNQKPRYRVNTENMIKKSQYDGENDENTNWIHYYSQKIMSPFYNSVRIGS